MQARVERRLRAEMDRLLLIAKLMEVMQETGVHAMMQGQVIHLVEMAWDRVKKAEG